MMLTAPLASSTACAERAGTDWLADWLAQEDCRCPGADLADWAARSERAEPSSKRARGCEALPCPDVPPVPHGAGCGVPAAGASRPGAGSAPSGAHENGRPPAAVLAPATAAAGGGGGGVAPLNPFALHRAFCPWVSGGGGGGGGGDGGAGAGGGDARVGWRWCLDVLVPAAGADEGEEGGSGGGSAFSRLDPAAKLRALLRIIGV